MKRVVMMLAVFLLLSAQLVKAQSHNSVWHDAKALTVVGRCEEIYDVKVILNTESENEVQLSVKRNSNEWTLCFPIDTIVDVEQCKTVWKFRGKSSMIMYHTDEGDVCKFIVVVPNSDPFEKIIFLFYM